MSQQIKPVVIPANSSVRLVINGNYYATVTSNGVFSVRFGNSEKIEQNAGRTYGDGTSEFTSLTFYNDTVAQITATYYVGNVPYQPDPSVVASFGTLNVTASSTVTNADTYTKATSAALASGGTLVLTGLDGAKKRKSLTIFNDHATDPLILRGANGTSGHKILAQQGYPLESGGGLTLLNPGANAITYYLMEVFYS